MPMFCHKSSAAAAAAYKAYWESEVREVHSLCSLQIGQKKGTFEGRFWSVLQLSVK